MHRLKGRLRSLRSTQVLSAPRAARRRPANRSNATVPYVPITVLRDATDDTHEAGKGAELAYRCSDVALENVVPCALHVVTFNRAAAVVET